MCRVDCWAWPQWSEEPAIQHVGVGHACLLGDLSSCNEYQALSSWPSGPQPAALTGDLAQALHCIQPPVYRLHWVRSHSSFVVPFSVLPAQLDSMGMKCASSLWFLCWWSCRTSKWGPCPATRQLPFLKSLYVAPTLQPRAMGQLSKCSTSRKSKNSLSQGCPQPAGASDSFRR